MIKQFAYTTGNHQGVTLVKVFFFLNSTSVRQSKSVLLISNNLLVFQKNCRHKQGHENQKQPQGTSQWQSLSDPYEHLLPKVHIFSSPPPPTHTEWVLAQVTDLPVIFLFKKVARHQIPSQGLCKAYTQNEFELYFAHQVLVSETISLPAYV